MSGQESGKRGGEASEMSPEPSSLTPEYFHEVYRRDSDPWNFESSPYEAAKYATTLESLPRARYARALEVGCSIGVLTERLAARCDELQSIDVSAQALERAKRRCSGLLNVTFERMSLPDQEPHGLFDLIVISEVAYYWNRSDLHRAIDLLAKHQNARGHLIVVHWTPKVPDYPLTGDQVHDVWVARSEY